jgi:minor extracellular serine protease Vpr
MRTPRPRSLAGASAAALGVAALAVAGLVGAAAGQSGGGDAGRQAVSEWRSVFGDRPTVSMDERAIVVLAAPSVADRAAAAKKAPTPRQQRRWARQALAAQRALLESLDRRGVTVRRIHAYTLVLNGFSALLGPRARAELERSRAVLGIYPVRAVYPASLSAQALGVPELGGGRRPAVTLPGRDGSGVTIALLDTGIDLRHPYLRGRLLPGFDLVDRDTVPRAEPKPDAPSRLEAHATRMAGLLAGSGGPGGLRGVAPGARILPIRILGWQQTSDGTWAVLGRGDLLVAGIERAVDPDGDGDSQDAAEIALAAVAEPFAAFADSPESRAVLGATRLGTLVVAPSGNDGGGGSSFGSVSAPGGSPAALTAGALDTRRQVLEARAVLRAGLDTVLDRHVRVLGVAGTGRPVRLSVTSPLRRGRPLSGYSLSDYLGPSGRSRVAGKAVLVPADGRALLAKARSAAAAGAAALLVYGTTLPAGALDLDESAPLPVLAIPAPAGREAVAAIAGGSSLSISLTEERLVPNSSVGTVAAFSSRGLAFDGRLKPSLVAPGVGLATADAARGRPRYATVTGTSAAAAVTAGAAALVAEARPRLDAERLAAVLVGGARPAAPGRRAEPAIRQGAGRLDPRGAAGAALVVQPSTLVLGRAEDGAWRAKRTITVRNLSKRALPVRLELVRDQQSRTGLVFAASPSSFLLRAGRAVTVRVVVSAPRGVDRTLSGVLLVRSPESARTARVPWAVAPRPASRSLVGSLRLSHDRFAPSASAPAILAFRAGRVSLGRGGETIEPVGLLELELLGADGESLGVLGRARDLLPGRYAFGLTGRGPRGKRLEPGRYAVRLRATPVDAAEGARASVASATFVVERP